MGYGYIEIKEIPSMPGWYGLYINGQLKEQSKDLDYIKREYSKY